MFGGRANLRGISEEQGLAVSEVSKQNICFMLFHTYFIRLSSHLLCVAPQVVHKATLDVDETGAEAAASTAILIGRTSDLPGDVLKFNRPFMVIITERNTEKILFLGKIINPTI